MWSSNSSVSAGDVVIIWQTRDSLLPLTIVPGKEINGRFGVYRHDDLVGIRYGTKVASRNGRGYIHILRPTPELWTLALPHRTQILYLADIAFITYWLDIKPGSVVIEAGTGSGSFSHSVARTIIPSGHLYSFEYHEERAKKARAEFTHHGMDEHVTLSHRNVCRDGFALENVADAVFLDLPGPWDAIQSAKAALKKDQTTRICCFSPCMEQVLRTVTALNDAGFTGISMFESLVRPHEVQSVSLPSVITAVNKLREAEAKGEERRLRQIQAAKVRNSKRKRDTEETATSATSDPGGQPENPSAPKKPRAREGDRDDTQGDLEAGEIEAFLLAPEGEKNDDQATVGTSSLKRKGPKPEAMIVAQPFTEVRGHTSYLTFAVLLPFEHLQSATIARLPQPHLSPPPITVTSTTEGLEEFAQYDELFRSIPDSELEGLV